VSEFSVRFHDGPMSSIESIIEHAERSAFASAALAVKLRELDEACIAFEFASKRKDRLHRECAQLLLEADSNGQSLHRKIYKP
jgi:hypothetical protein